MKSREETCLQEGEAGLLAGVTVLDFSRLLPGPYCSMLLADHGARVIQVSEPGTTGKGITELPLTTLGRNKESILLDMKSGQAREIFLRLCRQADVVIEGFRPGVTKKLGVDYDSLCARNPRLIYCSITGYGQVGRSRDRAGHDVNYLALNGMLSFFAPPGERPRIPGLQVADVTGSLYAALAITAALFQREKTGKGEYIDVSLADCSRSLAAVPFSLLQAGWQHACGKSILSHGLACYDVYQCLDGEYIALGALEPKFFSRLCELLDRKHLAAYQYDLARQDELRGELRQAFSKSSAADWEETLDNEPVCVTRVRTFGEALAESSGASGRSAGAVPTSPVMDSSGVSVSGKSQDLRLPPPMPGQHTVALLDELGYSTEAISALRRDGIVS